MLKSLSFVKSVIQPVELEYRRWTLELGFVERVIKTVCIVGILKVDIDGW